MNSLITSELIYRNFNDYDCLVVGFTCAHCDHDNFFDGDDADLMECTGVNTHKSVECHKCKKQSSLEQG